MNDRSSQGGESGSPSTEGPGDFRAVFDSLFDAVLIAGLDSGRILDANPSAIRMFAVSEPGLIGRPVATLFVEGAGASSDPWWERLSGQGSCHGLHDVRRQDGATFSVHLAAAIVPWAGGRAAVIALHDVSEWRRVEQCLEVSQERLRRVAAELAETEERERHRYARELHDRIGQNLAIARMRAALVRDQLPADQRAAMDEIASLLDDMIRDVRSLTFELCPPVLHELGLGAAIDWLAEHFQQRHGLHVRSRVVLRTALPHELASVFFQAVRELLMNVLKHAQAREVWVEVLETGQNEVEVGVLDDGDGIDVSRLEPAAPGTHGFGLFSIRERLRRHNGTLEITSRPSGGTEARMPVRLTGE